MKPQLFSALATLATLMVAGACVMLSGDLIEWFGLGQFDLVLRTRLVFIVLGALNAALSRYKIAQ